MTKRRVDWTEESTTLLKLPSVDQVDYAIGELPCVKLRGLPFDVTVEEILVFFRGLRLLDVILCTRYDGKPSGEAMVLFPTEEAVQQALQFDHQCIGKSIMWELQVTTTKRILWVVCFGEQDRGTSKSSEPRAQNITTPQPRKCSDCLVLGRRRTRYRQLLLTITTTMPRQCTRRTKRMLSRRTSNTTWLTGRRHNTERRNNTLRRSRTQQRHNTALQLLIPTRRGLFLECCVCVACHTT